MRQVVAIGGGDVGLLETLEIDRVLVEATGKRRPEILFVPTASGDDDTYAYRIAQAYVDALGCRLDVAWLLGADAERAGWEPKLARADAVYVGGGNTRSMIARWRELGFDTALRARWEDGLPVGGLSAGANCWFRACNSDADIMDGLSERTILLPGLGWIDAVYCPHLKHEPNRRPEFAEMVADEAGVAVGCDDHAALHWRGRADGAGEARILASQPGSFGWRALGGELLCIEPGGPWTPLEALGR